MKRHPFEIVIYCSVS